MLTRNGNYIGGGGLYLDNRDGQVIEIALNGDSPPHGLGRFWSLLGESINDHDQVAFVGKFSGTTADNTSRSGIYRYDGGEALVEMLRDDQLAPDGNGIYRGFDPPSINNLGHVAVKGFLVDFVGDAGRIALVLADGVNDPIQIVRGGQQLPDGSGSFSDPSDAALNDAGQIAFVSHLRETSVQNDQGIFLSNDSGEIDEVARKGQLADDGSHFSFFNSTIAINNRGQIAFDARLNAPSDGGLFVYDDRTGISRVVGDGDILLGSTITSALITSGHRKALNDNGQLAFQFFLADGRNGLAIASPVPEPAGVLLCSTAMLILLNHRRRVACRVG